MKKLFTLIALVLAAVSVNAAEKVVISTPVNLDNSDYGWYPGYIIDRSNFTVVPAGTEFIVEFTLNDGDSHGFRLCTKYSNVPLPGFEVEDKDNNYYPAADGSYTYIVSQECIDLLSNPGGIDWDNVRIVGAGVTITKAYFKLAEEEVIGSNINLDDEDYGWYPGYIFDRGIITSADAGWRIVIDYTLNAGDSHGFRLCTKYSNVPLPGFEVDDKDHNYYPSADGSYEYTINQECIDLLSNPGGIDWDNVRLVGAGVTVTSLKLVRSSSSTAITTAKTAKQDGATYNIAGQKVDASYKGLVIKDGKKYMNK